MNKKLSEIYCVMPFVHLATTPQGEVRTCCVGNDVLGHTGEIKEIWNGEALKNIRKAMIKGERISNCNHCHHEESLGSHSYRLHNNSRWKDNQIDLDDDCNVLSTLAYLDLRPDNQCNLGCRSCSPFSSSFLEREWEEISKKDSRFEEFYKSNDHESTKSSLRADFKELIPHLKMLYITGGEPSISSKIKDFLNACIEVGAAQNIEIFINSNISSNIENLLGQLQQFKIVNFSVSIDAIKEKHEYLRFPSSWGRVRENLNQLMKTTPSKFNISITPVIQISNLYHLTDLFSWVLKNYHPRVKLFPIFSVGSEFLDVKVLPPPMLRKSILMLNEFFNAHPNFDNSSLDRIKQIERYLRSHEAFFDEELLLKFCRYNILLDEERNQDFSKFFPEIYKDLNFYFEKAMP